MTNELFKEYITTILHSDKAGYGFVNDLTDYILSHNAESHVNHIISLWDYCVNQKKTYQVTYFSSSKLNLIGLNRDNILHATTPICSNDENIKTYANNNFIWHDRFIAIPINSLSNRDNYFNIRGALIFIFDKTPDLFTAEQLNTLHCVLNAKQPNIHNSYCAKKYSNDFHTPQSNLRTIGDKWLSLNNSLKNFAEETDGDKDSRGLRYATFWKINNCDNIENEPIYKQFEANYNTDTYPRASQTIINYNDEHYLNNIRISELNTIRIYTYLDVYKTFADQDYLKKRDLNEDNLSVIAIPVGIDGAIKSLDICCFYIKDIVYTPFIALDYITQFQNDLTKHLRAYNVEIESNMVTYLMDAYLRIPKQKQVEFYRRASETLAHFNCTNDCLIYVCSGKDTLLFTNMEDMNEPSSFMSKQYYFGKRCCYIPPKYSADKEFIKKLSSLELLENNDNNVYLYRSSRNDSIIKNALFITIEDSSKSEKSGVIILVNKNHIDQTTGVYDYDDITMDNVSISYLSALYLHQFGLWSKGISRKNYLLKKLRHEIPHCTTIIGDRVSQIRHDISSLGMIIPNIDNHTNTIEINRNRINILASFFAAVDYDDARFSEHKRQQDLINIITVNLPLLKEEAAEKGVELITRYHIEHLNLSISDFYPLAIINIINNAIRYCSCGTNIIIDVYEDRIEVTDIGIPIFDTDKEFIFDDGYRGNNAKEIDSQGIGFGLHISKRVLESHGSSILANSDYLSETNYFIEYAIAQYIKHLPPYKRQQFIYDTTLLAEKKIADQLYSQITKDAIIMENYSDFYNRNLTSISLWIEKNKRDGGPVFIEMEDSWFSAPIAKVTFTIIF